MRKPRSANMLNGVKDSFLHHFMNHCADLANYGVDKKAHTHGQRHTHPQPITAGAEGGGGGAGDRGEEEGAFCPAPRSSLSCQP